MQANTTSITLRLNHKTDADILKELDLKSAKSKAGQVKELIRRGLKNQKD
jgi:hypothetical protein